METNQNENQQTQQQQQQQQQQNGEQWDSNQQQNNVGQSEGGSGGNTNSSVTFTQEQVNAIASREKKDGKKSVFTELGYSEEEIKSIVQKHKEELSKQKTPDQIALEQTSKANLEKSEALKKAEERAEKAEAESQAMKLGVKPEFVEEAIVLAMHKKASAKEGEVFEFKNCLENEIKKKHPSWFADGQESGAQQSVTKKGTGNPPPRDDKGGNKSSIGQRLAASKKTATKNSFWD